MPITATNVEDNNQQTFLLVVDANYVMKRQFDSDKTCDNINPFITMPIFEIPARKVTPNLK